MTLTRRSIVLSALALPALAACGAQGGEDPADGTPVAAGSSDGGGEAGWPVTVQHLYGETVIEAEPLRIATVSWVNGDSVLALGIVPVGLPLVEWGGNDNGSTDWVDAALEELGAGWGSDGAPTQYSETDGVNADQIAALTPDLIVAAYSGLTQEDYDRLSGIAPVIGPLAANYTSAWQDVLTTLGAATGRADRAQELVDELEASLAAVGEEEPDVSGSTFIAGTLGLTDNTISLYTAGDTRPRFLTALGMTQAEVVTENTTDEEAFSLSWSAERADELDADVFYTWATAGTSIEDFQANPLFAQIPAVAAGALVLTADDHQTLAISAANALSIPWAVQNIVPSVVEAARAARA